MSRPASSRLEAAAPPPSGWFLCALYILATAPLVAGLILACGLLTSSIPPEAMIDLEDDLTGYALNVVQFAAAVGVLQVVFLVLRARFRVRPRAREDEGISFAPLGLALVAVLLAAGLLAAARHLGIYTPQPSLGVLMPYTLPYVVFGYQHLRSLRDP